MGLAFLTFGALGRIIYAENEKKPFVKYGN
jgi:hypothetical protein